MEAKRTDTSREDHILGLPRLLDPSEVDRARRQLSDAKGRAKWLARLAHNISMHADYTTEPPKGERSAERLLARLAALGAGDTCYVVASDSGLDDTFQSLKEMVKDAADLFGHGTIPSCIPGKLALFRSAHPHKHYITHRPE